MTRSWKPQWRIEIAEIDAQHEGLFDRFDAFVAEATDANRAQAAAGALAFLSRYVDEHFRDEEQAMLEAGYHGYAEHRGMHLAFVQELTELSDRFKTKGATPSFLLALANLFESWLTLHITRVDQKFGDYLKARRATGVA